MQPTNRRQIQTLGIGESRLHQRDAESLVGLVGLAVISDVLDAAIGHPDLGRSVDVGHVGGKRIKPYQFGSIEHVLFFDFTSGGPGLECSILSSTTQRLACLGMRREIRWPPVQGRIVVVLRSDLPIQDGRVVAGEEHGAFPIAADGFIDIELLEEFRPELVATRRILHDLPHRDDGRPCMIMFDSAMRIPLFCGWLVEPRDALVHGVSEKEVLVLPGGIHVRQALRIRDLHQSGLAIWQWTRIVLGLDVRSCLHLLLRAARQSDQKKQP